MLKGKTAIVTGGSRGIGAAIVSKLASMGANIAVIYAGNQTAAEAVCEKCRKDHGVEAKLYQCNVASFEETKAAVAAIKADFGTVHILVNNAGVTKDGLLVMMSEGSWDAVLDTNLKGAFNMIRHCTGLFLRAKEGCIINISSVSGLMGNAGQCNYSASKAGLVGLTKSVAKELAPKGIRCNAIAPGFLVSNQNRALLFNADGTPTARAGKILNGTPMGRFAESEELLGGMFFLTDDKAASAVTGVILPIDCGFAAYSGV